MKLAKKYVPEKVAEAFSEAQRAEREISRKGSASSDDWFDHTDGQRDDRAFESGDSPIEYSTSFREGLGGKTVLGRFRGIQSSTQASVLRCV
jgi:hypothetical protein